jgi:hypothetical protein
MFKIGTQRLAWMAVTWPGLAEDGTTVQNEIKLQVHLVDRTALVDQINAENTENQGTSEFAEKVTTGWQGVGDKDGNPLPFSKEHFAQLCESPGFAAAFGQCYLRAWSGQSGIRSGNSEASPAAGQAAAAGQTPASEA